MLYSFSCEISDLLKNKEALSLRNLYSLWNNRTPVDELFSSQDFALNDALPSLPGDLDIACHLTSQALRHREFLLAQAICEEVNRWVTLTKGLEANPPLQSQWSNLRMMEGDARLRLAQFNQAENIYESIREDLSLQRATRASASYKLGLLKCETAFDQSSDALRVQHLDEAYESFAFAEGMQPDYLEAAVRAVFLSSLLAQQDTARKTSALQRAKLLLDRLPAQGHTAADQILRASLFATLSDWSEVDLSMSRIRSLENTPHAVMADLRHTARWMAQALGQSLHTYDHFFPKLQLLVFSGHLLDLQRPDPNRPDSHGPYPTRFPLAAIDQVRADLRKAIAQEGGCTALCSAAAGADLLFLDAVQEMPDSAYHLVLPWSEAEFLKTSVIPYEPSGLPEIWAPMFKEAMANAASVRELGQIYKPGTDASWQYALEVNAGLSLLLARQLRLDPQPICLWNGLNGYGVGGTSDFYHFWDSIIGYKPQVVRLPGSSHDSGPVKIPSRAEQSVMQLEVKSLLFSDIVGYSKLPESVIPQFAKLFLGHVSRLAASTEFGPIHLNTWGDAIYAVFDHGYQAGRFALELHKMIRENEKEWAALGLSYEKKDPATGEHNVHSLNLRTALHTGPVLRHFNLLTRDISFTGTQVSRTARMEPITQPGEIFVSEEFAALVELSKLEQTDGTGSFSCEYVGSPPLAKSYPGRFHLYRLQARNFMANDDLAKAFHLDYCEEQFRQGKSPSDNPALCSWDKLKEEYRQSSRAAAADTTKKLRKLGYQLVSGPGLDPREIMITPEQLEQLAEAEHNRWMRAKVRQGYSLGPRSDEIRCKQSPYLIPYHLLDEATKELDRNQVRQMPEHLAKIGLRVRRIDGK